MGNHVDIDLKMKWIEFDNIEDFEAWDRNIQMVKELPEGIRYTRPNLLNDGKVLAYINTDDINEIFYRDRTQFSRQGFIDKCIEDGIMEMKSVKRGRSDHIVPLMKSRRT